MKVITYNTKTGHIILVLSDLFMYIFFALTFYCVALDYNENLLRVRFLFLSVSGILGYFLFFSKYYFEYEIWLYIILIILSWGLCYWIRDDGQYPFDLFKYSLMYIGVALNLLDHKHNKYPAIFLYYFICAIILFSLKILNIPIREFIQDGSSYNYISVLLLFFLCLYSVVVLQNQEKISLLAAILFFSICIIAYGRGGILSGMFFLIFITYIHYIETKSLVVKYLLFLLSIICIIFFVKTFATTWNVTQYFEKFTNNGFIDKARLDIWGDYFKNSFKNIDSIILGSNSFLVRTDGNLHNSLLQMYTCFGLIPFLVSIFIFFKGILAFLKKEKYMWVAIILTLLLRSFTDKLFFQGYCEIFFYYFIFKCIKEVMRDNKGGD